MLPDSANLEWLRKQAKRRLVELRQTNPDARLADAQFELAREHGFSSWRALKAHVDAQTIDGQLFEAARNGDAAALASLLDAHPDRLQARAQPYEWSLLHYAAHRGHLAVVDLLLARGLDVNTREKGDDTTGMHWAAAAGHLEIVRRLADAGGDIVGRGDDHGLDVIGWATCWEPCQTQVAEFLVSRGARHHIFSAIAMNLADDVRRIVGDDRSALNRRLTRNDAHRTPLHHAVLKRRPEMVSLLIDLGADPLAVDVDGFTAVAYATDPDTDRRILQAIHTMTRSEIDSAARGHRPPQAQLIDIVAAAALREWAVAEQLLREHPGILGGSAVGALPLMAKRNDLTGARWLLDHGADPNARWAHWDAAVTALHLASAQGHADMVRLLLAAGADPSIRDSKHDGDAAGWAEYGRMPQAENWKEIVDLLRR